MEKSLTFINFNLISRIEIIFPKEKTSYKYFSETRLEEIKRKFLFLNLPSRWIKINPGWYKENNIIYCDSEINYSQSIFDCEFNLFVDKADMGFHFIENNKLYERGFIRIYSSNPKYYTSIHLNSLNCDIVDTLKNELKTYPNIKLLIK